MSGTQKINYQQKIDFVVKWLKEYLKNANADGIVFGVSGGIDSALLCAIAHNYFPNNSLALTMNIENSQSDVNDAISVLKTFDKVKHIDINLLESYNSLKKTIPNDVNDLIKGNLKARMRMITLYSYGQYYNYLVCGTSNAAELLTGYFTKYGDSGSDILPLVNFPKTYIYECAKLLNVPNQIINKKPSAGLKANQYDEEELGVSYKVIDDYLLDKPISQEHKNKINQLIKRSEHKRNLPPSPLPKDKII